MAFLSDHLTEREGQKQPKTTKRNDKQRMVTLSKRVIFRHAAGIPGLHCVTQHEARRLRVKAKESAEKKSYENGLSFEQGNVDVSASMQCASVLYMVSFDATLLFC